MSQKKPFFDPYWFKEPHELILAGLQVAKFNSLPCGANCADAISHAVIDFHEIYETAMTNMWGNVPKATIRKMRNLPKSDRLLQMQGWIATNNSSKIGEALTRKTIDCTASR